MSNKVKVRANLHLYAASNDYENKTEVFTPINPCVESIIEVF